MLGNADCLESNAINNLQMPLLLHCLYGIWRETGSHKAASDAHLRPPWLSSLISLTHSSKMRRRRNIEYLVGSIELKGNLSVLLRVIVAIACVIGKLQYSHFISPSLGF
ncbi:hypothetical protein J3E68DRAFT_403733 [Trichoderma sp. SZMC 28012]